MGREGRSLEYEYMNLNPLDQNPKNIIPCKPMPPPSWSSKYLVQAFELVPQVFRGGPQGRPVMVELLSIFPYLFVVLLSGECVVHTEFDE